MNAKNRLDYVDKMRGFAILMVVIAVPICYISCWVAAYIRQFPVLDFLLIGNVKAFKRKSCNTQI